MKTSDWLKSKTSPAVQTISKLRMASANQENAGFIDWARLAAETFRLAQFPLPSKEELYAHFINGRSPLSALNVEVEDSKVT